MLSEMLLFLFLCVRYVWFVFSSRSRSLRCSAGFMNPPVLREPVESAQCDITVKGTVCIYGYGRRGEIREKNKILKSW